MRLLQRISALARLYIVSKKGAMTNESSIQNGLIFMVVSSKSFLQKNQGMVVNSSVGFFNIS